jgi:hypothetical protein
MKILSWAKGSKGSLAPAARALANFIRAEQPASPFSMAVE